MRLYLVVLIEMMVLYHSLSVCTTTVDMSQRWWADQAAAVDMLGDQTGSLFSEVSVRPTTSESDRAWEFWLKVFSFMSRRSLLLPPPCVFLSLLPLLVFPCLGSLPSPAESPPQLNITHYPTTCSVLPLSLCSVVTVLRLKVRVFVGSLLTETFGPVANSVLHLGSFS